MDFPYSVAVMVKVCMFLCKFLYLHLSLNRQDRWDIADAFTTSFLHFSLLSSVHWDLANSKPVHFLMLSSHLFFRLPCLLAPLKHRLARWFWPDLMNGRLPLQFASLYDGQKAFM